MHIFDDDICVEPESEGVLTAKVSNQWSINNIPNGGYIMALMTNAMMYGHSGLVTCVATANYIAKCDYKPARIFVEIISESRNFIRKQARLVQDGKERIRAMITFVKPCDQNLFQHYETEPEQMALPDNCFAVPPVPKYSLFDHVDIRLDPCCAGWINQDLIERSVQKGWIRFRDQREFDLPALVLFADSFPPCIFSSQGMKTWVPTIEFSVNVRKMPTTKWLKGIFKTRFVSSGLLEEDGELWDETGDLIAVSRQIAKYR